MRLLSSSTELEVDRNQTDFVSGVRRVGGGRLIIQACIGLFGRTSCDLYLEDTRPLDGCSARHAWIAKVCSGAYG